MPHKLLLTFLGIVTIAIFSFLPENPAPKELTQTAVASLASATNSDGLHRVLRVIDGDTISVDIDGVTTMVRLIGIDTPETVHPSEPVGCFGREASKKTIALVSGQQVRLEFDASQGKEDRYGRLLAYVFLQDGTAVNQYLIENGYAYEYTYQTPYAYQAEFKQAEADARSNERGLWEPGVCESETEPVTPAPAPIPVQSKISSQSCHPSYSGCLNPNAGDYDCAGGSGNGPLYTGQVRVIGPDVFDLDRDNDGIACE